RPLQRTAGGVLPLGIGVVIQERIELSTSPLPRECSTTELLQPAFVGRVLDAISPPCKRNLAASGTRSGRVAPSHVERAAWTGNPRKPPAVRRARTGATG